MDYGAVRKTLLNIIDEMGIVVDDDNNDFILNEYITDSLSFISFIIEIENQFNIEVPVELLLISKMNSFNAYCDTILSVVVGTFEE